MTRRVANGPRWTTALRGFQRRHGQQSIKRLLLAEAQTHGEVNWHHSGLGVTTKGMENSEDEYMTGLELDLLLQVHRLCGYIVYSAFTTGNANVITTSTNKLKHSSSPCTIHCQALDVVDCTL